MEPHIQVLASFLKHIGEDLPRESYSYNDRAIVQRVVYLGQLFGADLGYRFEWRSTYGPHSMPLKLTSIEMTELITDPTYAPPLLTASYVERLKKASEFLKVPLLLDLSKFRWYELLASTHYLHKISGLDAFAVRAVFSKYNKDLEKWIDVGENHFRKHGLL